MIEDDSWLLVITQHLPMIKKETMVVDEDRW